MWADHFSGETEVGNPDFEVLANKEVVKLEVSMADILRVHVAHCRHDLTSEEVRDALQEPVQAIIETVTRTLERAEPELAADLVDNGICLVGGGGLLRGLDVVLANATGLEVRVADDPLTSVARGTSIYLENLEEWKATMESDLDER